MWKERLTSPHGLGPGGDEPVRACSPARPARVGAGLAVCPLAPGGGRGRSCTAGSRARPSPARVPTCSAWENRPLVPASTTDPGLCWGSKSSRSPPHPAPTPPCAGDWMADVEGSWAPCTPTNRSPGRRSCYQILPPPCAAGRRAPGETEAQRGRATCPGSHSGARRLSRDWVSGLARSVYPGPVALVPR